MEDRDDMIGLKELRRCMNSGRKTDANNFALSLLLLSCINYRRLISMNCQVLSEKPLSFNPGLV